MSVNKKRILSTEDDPLLQELIEMLLEALGYELHAATNGKEAMDVVTTQQLDLIIVDLMMPVMDGKRFITWLRQEQKSKIPVLVLTAMDRPGVKEELLSLGATDVIFKPMSTTDLEAKVENILGESECSQTSSHSRSSLKEV